jgi:hypothetical protein
MSHEARFRVTAAVTVLFLAGLVAAGLASRDARPDPAAVTPRIERTTTHSSRPAQVVYRPVSAPAPRWEDEAEHGRGRGRGRGGDDFDLEEHEDD